MSTPIGWRHKETGALVSNDRMDAMRKDNPHFNPREAGYTNDVYAGQPEPAHARSTECSNLHATQGGRGLRLFGREFVADDLVRLVHARVGDVFRCTEGRDVTHLDLIGGPSSIDARSREYSTAREMRVWMDEAQRAMRIPDFQGVFPRRPAMYQPPINTGRIQVDIDPGRGPSTSALTAEAQHLRELLRTPEAPSRQVYERHFAAFTAPNETPPERNQS